MSELIYYYYQNTPLFQCKEGSLLDIVVKDTIRRNREKETKAMLALLDPRKPLKLKHENTRNILDKIKL